MAQNQEMGMGERAARDGVPMGLCLTVMALCIMNCDRWPWLGLAALLLMVAMVPLTGAFLRRTYEASGRTLTFSALWMQGIVMFLAAAIITTLTSYVFLRFARPDYFYAIAQQAADAAAASPYEQDRATAHLLQRMIDDDMLPTQLQMAFLGFWTAAFGGAVLSAIVAAVVRHTGRKRNFN